MDHPPPHLDATRPRKQPKPAPQSDLTVVPLAHYVSATGSPLLHDPCHPLTNRVPIHAAKLAGFRAAVAARDAALVLLAAGQGSRFRASVPKVVHPFRGKPLARYGVDAAASVGLPVIVVVGHERETVRQTLAVAQEEQVVFVCQERQMGTGHAVYLGNFALPRNFDGDIVISYADNPGIDRVLLEELLSAHKENRGRYGDGYGAMVLTGSRKVAGKGAAAYGRIVRQGKDGSGTVVDIVELKTIRKLKEDGKGKTYGSVTWTAQELEDIDEYNSGIVVARGRPYSEVLADIVASQTSFDPPKYEYYATDFVKGLVSRNMIAEGFLLPEESQWKLEGANTVDELHDLERRHQEREDDNDDEADVDDDDDDDEP